MLPRVLKPDRGRAEVLRKRNQAPPAFSAPLPRTPAAAVRGRKVR